MKWAQSSARRVRGTRESHLDALVGSAGARRFGGGGEVAQAESRLRRRLHVSDLEVAEPNDAGVRDRRGEGARRNRTEDEALVAAAVPHRDELARPRRRVPRHAVRGSILPLCEGVGCHRGDVDALRRRVRVAERVLHRDRRCRAGDRDLHSEVPTVVVVEAVVRQDKEPAAVFALDEVDHLRLGRLDADVGAPAAREIGRVELHPNAGSDRIRLARDAVLHRAAVAAPLPGTERAWPVHQVRLLPAHPKGGVRMLCRYRRRWADDPRVVVRSECLVRLGLQLQREAVARRAARYVDDAQRGEKQQR